MTDLQCPATAVLLAAGAALPDWLARLPVAARFDLPADQDLAAFLEETADRFRGETFVVTAPTDAIARAVRRAGPGPAPAVLEIDSDGWRPVPAPRADGALPSG